MESKPNLVVDWGNTRIKAAAFHDNTLLHHFSFAEKAELEEFLRERSFQNILFSSVSGNPNELIKKIDPSVKVVLLSSSTPLPIKILYTTPNTLGVDRIAAACGVWQLFPNQPSFVIDLGSCINYEFVDDTGNYYGGAISPGVNMRFEAMHRLTAKLPLIKPTELPLLIGDSTETCMQSGVMNGVLAELKGFIEWIKKDNPSCNVILCGGDAHFFEGKIKDANFVPELVLIGLNHILIHNLNL